jgi:hypothetical protein
LLPPLDADPFEPPQATAAIAHAATTQTARALEIDQIRLKG